MLINFKDRDVGITSNVSNIHDVTRIAVKFVPVVHKVSTNGDEIGNKTTFFLNCTHY